MAKLTTDEHIIKATDKGIYAHSKSKKPAIAFINKLDWKKCTYKEFEEHVAKVLIYIKERHPNSVLISKNYLLINVLGVHTKHWRRDLLAKQVVKGNQKLELLMKIVYLQEQNLLDYVMNGNAPNVVGMIYSIQFKKDYENEDMELSENETLKEGIKIEIKGSGIKYD